MNLSDMTDDERRELLKRALGLDVLPDPRLAYVECPHCRTKFVPGDICPTCWNAMLSDIDPEQKGGTNDLEKAGD